jgi:hypothetical protein
MSRLRNARSFVYAAFKRIAYRRSVLSTSATVDPVPLRQPIRLDTWRDVASHQTVGCRTVASATATDALPVVIHQNASDDERLRGGSATTLTSAVLLPELAPEPDADRNKSARSLCEYKIKSDPHPCRRPAWGVLVLVQAAHMKFLQLLNLKRPF